MKKWFHFILSHSIFISLCAIALCVQTYLLVGISYNPTILILVGAATLASYNFYWILSKYSFAGRPDLISFLRKNVSYFILLILSGIVVLYCLFNLPFTFLLATAGATVLTLLYAIPLWPFSWARAMRKVGLVKTILLSLTWAYVTVLLPLISQEFNTEKALLLFISRFSFMLILCILFDLRDLAMDKIHALHSIATDMHARVIKIILALAFSLFIVIGVMLRSYLNNDYQIVAFILICLSLALLYFASRKKRGYIFYYFLVDGMMLLSGLLCYLAQLMI